MTEKEIEFRIRVLECAEKSVHQPYINTGMNSAGADNYRDKDLREILDRADKMLRWCIDGTETPEGPETDMAVDLEKS